MNHLKWMGHQSTIYDIQKSLRHDPHSCEVTLAGRGKSVRAHRFVLSSCSDLLRSLLADVPIGHEATIVVPDIKGSLLESVLAFIYMGETCLNSNNLSEFLEAINQLGIKSAISFECNTGIAVASGSSSPLKTLDMQMSQDEIIEEEPIPSPKMEEQSVMEAADQQNVRELEFLDVYNEPQPKITYSIEHMTPATSNEFILTENSGTYTFTQSDKMEGEIIADDKVEEEPEEDEEEEEVDDSQIMEEYSSSAEPMIEVNSVNNATTSNNTTTATNNSTLNYLKPKQKTEKRLPPQYQHVNQSPNTLVSSAVGSSMSMISPSPDSSYTSNFNDSQARDENLEQAVQGVLNEGMSLQKAAIKYHISKTVLWRRVRKHPMYMKTARENPVMEAACNRLKNGESLKVISQALDIPMSTLHRHKVRLAQQGRLPDYISFKKRGCFSKEQLKEKLTKAVQACLHEGMSQNHAANMFDIPKSTLWRHLQKRMNEAQLCLDGDDAIKEEIILS